MREESGAMYVRHCVECGKGIVTPYDREWFTCSVCGKPVHTDCGRKHTLVCMALTWGLAKKDPVTGELIKEERPRTLSW